jgi:hypothetical protein
MRLTYKQHEKTPSLSAFFAVRTVVVDVVGGLVVVTRCRVVVVDSG